MAELSEKIAKKQFEKFAKEYNKSHNSNFIWCRQNPVQNDNWDFCGKNEADVLKIQYTEAIVNHPQKANLEAHKRGEYVFEYAIGIKVVESVGDAYVRKLKMADKNIILLIGFHDFSYEQESRLDGIEKIKQHMKSKFKKCLFKELWIINLDDNSCDFIF